MHQLLLQSTTRYLSSLAVTVTNQVLAEKVRQGSSLKEARDYVVVSKAGWTKFHGLVSK
jgi:hypothetical protein